MSLRSRCVQSKPEYGRVPLEILVGGVNRQASACSDRTDQHVYARSLNAFRAASIGELRRTFVVRSLNRFIREGCERVTQAFELRLVCDTAQQFLTDRSDKPGPTLTDEFTEFRDDYLLGARWPGTPKCNRPNARVDQNVHLRCRARL